MTIIEGYNAISGQLINKDKSSFYLGKHARSRADAIKECLGMNRGGSCFVYLGVSIFRGKPSRAYLQASLDKVVNKLQGWQGSILSMAGRVELVRSVVYPILHYNFRIYKWPVALVRDLQSNVCNFIWTGSALNRNYNTVSWDKVCTPKDNGGLGLRCFKMLNKGALLKTLWELYTGDGLWSKICRARYNSANYKVSSTWPGFKLVYSDLMNNSRWLVSNGMKTNFWTDNWLGAPIDPLNTSGLKVSTCIVNGQWCLPDHFHDLFPAHAAEIQNVRIALDPREDKMIWSPTSDGKLSFRDAYEFYRPPVESIKWFKMIWSTFIPPKCSIVFWRGILNRLPTHELLKKKGIQMASRCALCGSQEETLQHLFIDCSFSKCVWSWLYSAIDGRLHHLDCSSINNLWQDICRFKIKCSSLIFNIIVVGFILVFYCIWKARNDKIFRGKITTANQGILWVKANIRSIDSRLKGYSKGTVDEFMVVKGLGLSNRTKNSSSYTPVYWTPPPPDWIKLNSDGHAMGSPGPAAVGGVFRDSKGTFLGCFMHAIGSETSFYAEMLAVIMGIEYAWNRNWRNIWIESDSVAVVRCLMNMSFDAPWSLYTRWINCRFYLAHMRYYCSHIYREGNMVADRLSKMGMDHDTTWLDVCPAELHSLLAQDMSGCPYYRI